MGAAPAYALRNSGVASRRESGTPRRGVPTISFSRGAARRLGVPRRSNSLDLGFFAIAPLSKQAHG
jgi:hypothetical protein